MKRFAFWFVLGLVAISVIKSNREQHRAPRSFEEQGVPSTIVVYKTDGPKVDKRGAVLYKVAGEDRRAMTLKQIAKRYPNSKIVEIDNSDDMDDDKDDNDTSKGVSVSVNVGQHRVRVEGLPVPVIKGTRTTEASTESIVLAPQAPNAPVAPEVPAAPNAPAEAEKVVTTVDEFGELKDVKVKPITSVTGRISATEARAKADARVQLIGVIRSRLEDEIPQGWQIPGDLVESLIQKTDIKTSQREFGTYYEATLTLDPNPEAFQRIAAAYQHEQVVKRLTLMGGGLGFVLLCLGTLTGYIKADEATKGYYTNRLRLASAAGVGAGGVLLYQMLIHKI